MDCSDGDRLRSVTLQIMLFVLVKVRDMSCFCYQEHVSGDMIMELVISAAADERKGIRCCNMS